MCGPLNGRHSHCILKQAARTSGPRFDSFAFAKSTCSSSRRRSRHWPQCLCNTAPARGADARAAAWRWPHSPRGACCCPALPSTACRLLLARSSSSPHPPPSVDADHERAVSGLPTSQPAELRRLLLQFGSLQSVSAPLQVLAACSSGSATPSRCSPGVTRLLAACQPAELKHSLLHRHLSACTAGCLHGQAAAAVHTLCRCPSSKAEWTSVAACQQHCIASMEKAPSSSGWQPAQHHACESAEAHRPPEV